MRTTVRLDDALLKRARREAARRNVTLTSLIDQGLRLAMQPQAPERKPRKSLPVCTAGGGTLPGVNLNDSAGLLDIMDSDTRSHH